MLSLRAALRIWLALHYTLICWLAVLLGRILHPKGGPGRWRWIRGVYRRWGRGMAWILGVETRVIGSPPKSPFLLVSNHQTYLDIFLLAGAADCTFVAKSEIMGWPVFGHVCRSVDTVFINRERRRDVLRAGQHMAQVLEEGRGVTLFAEGTTSTGESILPLKSSLLAGAAAMEIPVHHAVLTYRTESSAPPAREVVPWVGDDRLGRHLWRLAKLHRIYATVTFGENPIRDSDRKKLAQRLRDSMLARYTPERAAEAPCTPPEP